MSASLLDVPPELELSAVTVPGPSSISVTSSHHAWPLAWPQPPKSRLSWRVVYVPDEKSQPICVQSLSPLSGLGSADCWSSCRSKSAPIDVPAIRPLVLTQTDRR